MQTPDYETYCKNITLTFPKLEKIEKDLKFMVTDTQMFIYHTLNGRFEEAESYRQSILHEQEQIKEELKPACPPTCLSPTPEDNVTMEYMPIEEAIPDTVDPVDNLLFTMDDLEISNDINVTE
jgi:hypothetical protein